ncbi:hypothetical protein ACM8BJ_23955 [Pseudomonas aeruginosa]|nr:hypothetical protein [Pseudomonas aeruginosa]MDY1219147.1 hypothetical protein [Pseudomonas aeruginosa]
MTTQPSDSTTSEVAPIHLGVSDALNHAAQRMVLNKYIMDRAVKDYRASMLARDLCDYGPIPHEPTPFLYRVLPFFFLSSKTSMSCPALVPTSNTLGGSWKRSMKNFDYDDVPAMVDKLTDAKKMLDGSLGATHYDWIKPLGLIAPSEGKNRVDFLRGQSIDYIPALVTEHSYPSPERLSLYRIQVNGFSAIWAVLDGRWVTGVENPSWTLPVMEAYCVGVSASWPSDFPAPELVIQALFGPRGTTTALGHPDAPEEPIVDLDTLKATEAYMNEPVPANLANLNNARIDPRFWLITASLTILGLFGLAVAPDTWDVFQLAAAMIFSGSLAAALLPLAAPIALTQRRYVTKHPFLPLERSPKHKATRSRRLG